MAFLNTSALSISYLRLDHRAARARETVVLVHGLASSLGFWFLRIGPALATKRHVIMFDLRGHGRSSIPRTGYTSDALALDLRDLFDGLGIESAHVVGHSYGGSVALRFACDYPDRVTSLTLADTRLRSLQPAVDKTKWKAWPRYRMMFARIGIDVGDQEGDFGVELFERLARLRLERPAAMEQLRNLIPLPFGGPRGDTMARRWLELLEKTTVRQDITVGDRFSQAELKAVSVPMLLVYGEHSQALPTAEALVRICPHARFEMVARGGHFFPMSMPDRLVIPYHNFVDVRARQELHPAVI